MRRRFTVLFFCVLAVCVAPRQGSAERLKEIADLEGVRQNTLLGYGLVVGLAGTGDDAAAELAVQSVASMLRRLGVRVDAQRLQLRNVAAVVVTAELPPFVAPGQKIDVHVSSIGNARSLYGGTLLSTPLKGADMEVYAVAQGPLLVGGFVTTGRTGSSTQRNQPTVGRIPGGALVERAIDVSMMREVLNLTLKSPDFTTAARLADALHAQLLELAGPPPVPQDPATKDAGNDAVPSSTGVEATEASAEEGAENAESEDGEASVTEATESPPEPEPSPPDGADVDGPPLRWADAADAGMVRVQVPVAFRGRVAALMAKLEGLEVAIDVPSRVVVNERTGTVVLGGAVRIAPVAIAHGDLTLEVREGFYTSQPNAFGEGDTQVVPQSDVSFQEEDGKLREVSGASLGEVVRALNALGVAPRDLVSILQVLKDSGALRAELKIQ